MKVNIFSCFRNNFCSAVKVVQSVTKKEREKGRKKKKERKKERKKKKEIHEEIKNLVDKRKKSFGSHSAISNH